MTISIISHSDLSTSAIGPFLVISRHDFRSPRKANMHFIAEELALRGPTRFFSFGFSLLSCLKHDPRLSLWRRSNRVEALGGVECYLWRTPLHPVNLRRKGLKPIERFLFRTYRAMAPKTFRQWIAESNTIILESGFPVIFIRLCRALNPNARLLYNASDSLVAIDCANFICDEFRALAPTMDGIRVPSPRLKDEMGPGSRVFHVPHGIDKSIADDADPSPYGGGINAVAIGSMLFDPVFFEIAASAFPEITFHVIGGGHHAAGLAAPNIVLYGEMPYLKTIPYLRHANFGIAPYNGVKAASFLADTSMKLTQCGFLGVPAVCPRIVAGAHPGRFGYDPGDHQSIVLAIKNALALGHFPVVPALSWAEVTDRLLAPQNFADTRVDNSPSITSTTARRAARS
jgi:2-beta-glucuronyltransferase